MNAVSIPQRLFMYQLVGGKKKRERERDPFLKNNIWDSFSC